jgi:hypothetical protein
MKNSFKSPAILLIGLLGIGASAIAGVLHVAAYGSDSPTCGHQSPCRSISQAMENAASGDTIYVGPGLYGDVNADNFTGPGDEQANPFGGGDDQPLNPGCVVCITKPLHIYSTQGAATTIIANDPQSPYGSTVLISSPGVDFGAAGEGFTLVGGSQAGVTIALLFPILQDVSVAGNTDNGDTQGFVYFGYPIRLLPCAPPLPRGQGFDCRVTGRILIAHNQAIGNGTGFSIGVNNGGRPAIIVRDNVALGAGTGFVVQPVGPGSESLFNPSATNVQLVANVAMGGGVGFSASDPGQITYNMAVKNSQIGFEVNPGGAAFYGNSAIGNGGPGVLIYLNDINDNMGFPEFTPNTFAPFTGNNFIGNDRNRPALTVPNFSISAGPGAHCGVLMGFFLPPGFVPPGSGLFPPPPPAQAPQLAAGDNYWGSADGPSSAAPDADAVGGACNQDGTTTIATPFSKTPFPVRALQ